MSDFTRADACVIACAEIYRGDGEILANPTVGFIPFIGARLARATFEPDLLMTDGESMLVSSLMPVGVAADVKVVEGWLPYRLSFDYTVWTGRRHVVMGASQVSRYGDTNISSIGPWERPKVQLLGARGAPGNTVNHATSYWVPNHSTRVFVEEVDFVSGLGPARARSAGGTLPHYNDIRAVVTDLCVIDFKGPGCAARLRSVHPGVTVDEVAKKTGFQLAIPDRVTETRAPTAEELRLIREVIDPAGTRLKEVPG
jgi:acyl CoA:acetate/3-ketoacid CoA transferase beta subunit